MRMILLTRAGVSTLDDLKMILREVRDLRESERVEVEVLKEGLVVQQRVKELQKKIATRKSIETCKNSISLSELIELQYVSAPTSVSSIAKAWARKRAREESGIRDDCAVSYEYSYFVDNMMQ